MSVRTKLRTILPESFADQETTITYLWITFLMTFAWASMVSYTQGVVIIIASTIAYVIFELVIMRRMVLHYYMWYLITCLLAVSISRLLLNVEMLRSQDIKDIIDNGLENTV